MSSKRETMDGYAVNSVNILIGGEAGQGLATVGQVLAESFVRAGFMIGVTQDYQSRIRGGHNTFAVRVSDEPVAAPPTRFDLLVALNVETIELHRGELRDGARIIVDRKIELPDEIREDPRLVRVPFGDLTESRYGNTVALGVAVCMVGLDEGPVQEALEGAFEEKSEEILRKNREALQKAFVWCKETYPEFAPLLGNRGSATGRVLMHGNEAIALGALSAGIGLYAYYPMTPSTSIAMSLLERKASTGHAVIVEQAEDEIAAINMAIGSSFVGVPGMVGTSGGGFALMVEGVSLAAMTETPVVIAVAQRPGPATGLPTRTEQGDLDMVLHAGHGEFPRPVFAPGSVEECFEVTRTAFEVAELVQGPVFILTDQFLADTLNAVEPIDPDAFDAVAPKLAEAGDTEPYHRYSLVRGGRSPRLAPGQSRHLVIADSDEHTELGHLTEDLRIRPEMVEKRLSKEDAVREKVIPPLFEGDEEPEVLFVSWGSSRGPVAETARILRDRGTSTATLHFPQVWPLVPEGFMDQCARARRVIMVEGNATGQFSRLLRCEGGVRITDDIRRYDGLPFTPEYILAYLEQKG